MRRDALGDEGWVRYVLLALLSLLLVVVAIPFGWYGDVFGGALAPGGGRPIDPALFASGSCVEYGPTSGNLHEVVFLDAGHGGVDPGAVGRTTAGETVEEGELTLPIELDTMALLRAHGFTVVVSRTRQSTVMRLASGDLSGDGFSLIGAHDEVAARDICANEARADLLVGIYLDAGAPGLAGCVTTYDADRPFSSDNERLAHLLQRSELAAMNGQGWAIPSDGVLDDVGMGSSNGNPADGGLAAEAARYDHVMLIGPAMTGYFSTPSRMPGAVIEPLYLTDPEEASLAASSTGQHVLAEGIAGGIEQYFAR